MLKQQSRKRERTCKFAPPGKKGRRETAKARRVQPGITVHRRGEAIYYSARQKAGNFELLCKTEKSKQVALTHQRLLADAARRAATPAFTSQGLDFGSRLHEAVRDVFSEQGICPQAAGFRFVVCFRSTWASVPVRTHPYRMPNIEAGLEAWRRLQDTWSSLLSCCDLRLRSSGPSAGADWKVAIAHWECFREAFFDIMIEAGSSPRRMTQRLEQLEGELRERLKSLSKLQQSRAVSQAVLMKATRRRNAASGAICRSPPQAVALPAASGQTTAQPSPWRRHLGSPDRGSGAPLPGGSFTAEDASASQQQAEQDAQALLRRWVRAKAYPAQVASAAPSGLARSWRQGSTKQRQTPQCRRQIPDLPIQEAPNDCQWPRDGMSVQ